MSDTPNGETAMTQPLDNNVTVPTTPVVNVDPTVADALKKAEQAQMEANMLRNKLKAIEDATAAARAKELEDQQEYKTLYEQEKAERERIAQERDSETQKVQIAQEESKITATYPQEVLEIAKELGFSLTDSSEEAVAVYKAKLDKVSEKVGVKNGITPNNTRTVTNSISREEKLQQYRQTGDPTVISQVINDLSFVKPYTQQ
jgi:hypothetical protein